MPYIPSMTSRLREPYLTSYTFNRKVDIHKYSLALEGRLILPSFFIGVRKESTRIACVFET